MLVISEAAKSSSCGKVDWRTVRGLMEDAIYGGRVDNPHDARVLVTYLRRFFNSDVVSRSVLARNASLCSFSRRGTGYQKGGVGGGGGETVPGFRSSVGRTGEHRRGSPR